MGRDAGDAVANQVACEGLKAAPEHRTPYRWTGFPRGRRLDKRAAIAADEHPADGSRTERQSEAPKLVGRIVRAPGVVAEHRPWRGRERAGPLDDDGGRGGRCGQTLGGCFKPLI